MEITPTNMTPASPRWVHYLAIAAACATFPLIVLGGLVTSYDVGMAVPDVPTTFGQNMLLYPLSEWMLASFGVRLEHSHRVFGAAVGLLTLVLSAAIWADSPRRWVPWLGGIVLASVFARGSLGPGGLLLVGGLTTVLALAMWARDRSHWLRWLGLVALGLVLAQGGFGALRVLLNARAVALIHGCMAQMFFALMACLVLFTSRGWATLSKAETTDARKLQRLGILTTGFVLLQLVLGAALRHLGGPAVLVAHLTVAVLVVVHVGLLAKRVFMCHATKSELVRSIEILAGLVLGQLMLGAGAWATSPIIGPEAIVSPTLQQIIFTTAHVAVGALILATCVLFTVRCYSSLVPVAGRPTADDEGKKTPSSRRTKPQSARPSIGVLEPRELWMAEVTA